MAEAAEFTLHLLRAYRGTGVLHFSPSYSPENHPGSSSSQACVDATVDVALARDLLSNLLSAKLLDLVDPRVDRWRSALHRLPEYRITAGGEFAEYLPATLTDNHAHRPSSYLFPFLYEIPPDVAARPDLLDATRAAVRARLRWLESEENDGEMAFGLAMLG